MNADKTADRLRNEDEAPAAIPGAERAEAAKRLQIGIAGIATMLLLVGLANVIRDKVTESDRSTVPEAAATVAPHAPPPNKDPLADAGVVPEMSPPASTPAPEPQGITGDPTPLP